MTLALLEFCVGELSAFLVGRLAEELMPAGIDDLHELLPETAGVAQRRQRGVHVVADRALIQLVRSAQLLLGDLARGMPGRAVSRRPARHRQAGEGKLADAFAHVKDDVADIRAAPLLLVGPGALMHDTRDVALADLRLEGRCALEV